MTPINERSACKITVARLGFYEGRYGLHFDLSGKGWGVGHSRLFGWSGQAPDAVAAHQAMTWLNGILGDAKAQSLHELVGKPAVVEWSSGDYMGGICTGFRIMTEVV